jgi:DNA-binding Xre family transcriptional regulator
MRSSFPIEFQKVLVLKSTNYTHLCKAMERRGYRLSKQFLHQIGTGKVAVPALQLNRICETLQCSEDEKRNLSVAACRDNGFFL